MFVVVTFQYWSSPFDGGSQDVPDSSVQDLQHTSQQQNFCGLTCHLWEGKEEAEMESRGRRRRRWRVGEGGGGDGE